MTTSKIQGILLAFWLYLINIYQEVRFKWMNHIFH